MQINFARGCRIRRFSRIPYPTPPRLSRIRLAERNLRFRFFSETSKGRLPLEHGSDRRETLGKRVSDDLQHFIFRRPKIFPDEIFGARVKIFCMICSFWKSWIILSITSIFSMRNDPISPKVQVSTFLGEGVQRRFSNFSLTFSPKPTYSFSSRKMI